MATKKPTTPKIPAVIAKPSTPSVIAKPAAPTQSLNVYGSPSTNARPVVKPVVTPKPSGSKIPAPKTNAQIAADAQKILDQLGAVGQRLDTLYTQDGKPKDDAKDDVVVGEDPSLVFAKMQEEKARVDAFALLKDAVILISLICGCVVVSFIPSASI